MYAATLRSVRFDALLAVLAFGIANGACVLSDLDDYAFREQTTVAGAGGELPGTSGSAGAAATGNASAGQSGGSAAVPTCENGAHRCLGDSVQDCVDREWSAPVPCGEPNPVCNAGACASLRLSGGLVSMNGAPISADIRLVDHGFESLPTVCGMVNGSRVCVMGELRP
jgi:hypothetical protein